MIFYKRWQFVNKKKQGEETAPGAAVFSPCVYALSGRLLVRLHGMALSL